MQIDSLDAIDVTHYTVFIRKSLASVKNCTKNMLKMRHLQGNLAIKLTFFTIRINSAILMKVEVSR